MGDKEVFSTPWFSITEKYPAGWNLPHYSLNTKDYVSVLALTRDKSIILVRQYRPAVDKYTLELPGGHVEPGSTPEQAARLELLEESGYTADHFVLLRALSPDVGRLSNRLWCYMALNAYKIDQPKECGVEPTLYYQSIADLAFNPEFCHAQGFASLFIAQQHFKLFDREDQAS